MCAKVIWSVDIIYVVFMVITGWILTQILISFVKHTNLYLVLQYGKTNGEVDFLKVSEMTSRWAITKKYHSKTSGEYLEYAQTKNFACWERQVSMQVLLSLSDLHSL